MLSVQTELSPVQTAVVGVSPVHSGVVGHWLYGHGPGLVPLAAGERGRGRGEGGREGGRGEHSS